MTQAKSFEGVKVYLLDRKKFNHGSAVCIPGIGIIIGKSQIDNNQLLMHEFGHVLQYREKGFFFFWFKIAPSSLYSAYRNHKKGHLHKNYWTEISANNLSYRHFNRPIEWDFKNFPIK